MRTKGMIQWTGIRYFRPDSKVDNWGDPSKMKRGLLLKLDVLRDHLGVPIFVTSAYRPNDSGQHGRGIAADLIAPGVRPMDLYFAAERFGFGGLGVYRDWWWKKQENIVGGVHADDRKGHGRWICYKDDDGIQRYKKLSMEMLEKYKMV